MRILAIDTALNACSAAVLDTARGRVLTSKSLPMTRGHAEAVMPLIAQVMDQSGVEFRVLDRIVVTVGPGSFTGLRVGISAARGIALAAGKPAIGLTTLVGFAAPHIATGDARPVVSVIDARQGYVYLQVFGDGGRTLIPPKVAPLREAVRTSMAGPARVVGSAAELIASAWPQGEPPPALVDQRGAPDIDWVAQLGVAAEVASDPPKPFYLRAPDTLPQNAARLPRR